MIAALDGWQLAAVVIVAVLVAGLLLLVVLVREGRSRRVRVGVFVERDVAPPLEQLEPWPGDDTLEIPPRTASGE